MRACPVSRLAPYVSETTRLQTGSYGPFWCPNCTITSLLVFMPVYKYGLLEVRFQDSRRETQMLRRMCCLGAAVTQPDGK